MPIQVNSLLSSSVANATFLDKTIDDQMDGQLTLNDGATATITNAQEQINKNSKSINAAQSVVANEQLSLNTESMNHLFRLSGNGGAVNMNSILFSNQPQDGSEIVIIGQDDTNTVTINFNSSQYGQFINGNATLLKGYSITFIYDIGTELFIEKGRNF